MVAGDTKVGFGDTEIIQYVTFFLQFGDFQ